MFWSWCCRPPYSSLSWCKCTTIKYKHFWLFWFFSYRNVFQNSINTLAKSSKFCIVRTIRFCSNSTSTWSKYLSSYVWRDLIKLQMSASEHKIPDWKISFCSKFAVKTLPCYSCYCWHWKSTNLTILMRGFRREHSRPGPMPPTPLASQKKLGKKKKGRKERKEEEKEEKGEKWKVMHAQKKKKKNFGSNKSIVSIAYRHWSRGTAGLPGPLWKKEERKRKRSDVLC